jgi:hypothetical protein
MGGAPDVARAQTEQLSGAMSWNEIASAFEWDGSWRDIYILRTSALDWEKVWGILTADGEILSFWIDGQPAPPPKSAAEAFQLSGSRSVTASYRLEKQSLNCHFFCIEEIEFDLDPREIDGPAQAEKLAAFMAIIGRACSKQVRLTPENCRENPLALFDPVRDELDWLPAPM